MRLELANGKILNVSSEQEINSALDSLNVSSCEFATLGDNNFIQVAIENDSNYLVQFNLNDEMKECYINNLNSVKELFIQFFNNDYSFTEKYPWEIFEQNNQEPEQNNQNNNEEDFLKNPLGAFKKFGKKVVKNEINYQVKKKIRRGIGKIIGKGINKLIK